MEPEEDDAGVAAGEVSGRVAALAQVSATRRERGCQRLAQAMLERGWTPAWVLESADFGADPHVMCAERYWRGRLLAEPSTAVAVECALWIAGHALAAHRQEIAERWALEFGQLTSDSVESAGELAEGATGLIAVSAFGSDVAYFAVVYHGGKLRANLACDELERWMERSPLALACGPELRQRPVFLALCAFAAFGDRSTPRADAEELWQRAWSAPGRTRTAVEVCLGAYVLPFRFDGPAEQGALLAHRAAQAVEEYPEYPVFRFYFARGQRLAGQVDEALDSIDDALRLLPADGDRLMHSWWQEKFFRERDRIHDAASHGHADGTELPPPVPVRRERLASGGMAAVIRRLLHRPDGTPDHPD